MSTYRVFLFFGWLFICFNLALIFTGYARWYNWGAMLVLIASDVYLISVMRAVRRRASGRK